MVENNKITIITVVYNSVNLIEETINSVLNQTYTNIEYIIIDGYSTDGTIEVISKYKSKINCFISEKDHGIYDAMNKALNYVTGSWIVFMNSGDKFYNNKVLSDLNFNSTYDLYFGATKIISNNSKFKIRYPISVDNIWKGMICCHQSIIFNSNIFKSTNFNIKYSLSADYNLIYSLVAQKAKIAYINNVIAIYFEEGVSKINYNRVLKQNRLIALSYESNKLNKLIIKFYYLLKIFLLKLKNIFFI